MTRYRITSSTKRPKKEHLVQAVQIQKLHFMEHCLRRNPGKFIGMHALHTPEHGHSELKRDRPLEPTESWLSRRQKKFLLIGFRSGKIILIEFGLNSNAESFVKFLNWATRRVQNIKRVSRFLGATIRFEL